MKSYIADLDKFEIGTTVVARFTNSGYAYEFTGIVVGKTKNYWKVKSTVSPYPTEAPGRVFHIATPQSRTYSPNNQIVKLAPREE